MKTAIFFCVLSLLIIKVDAQERIVLIEKFSSSTCPPCKTFSQNVFSPFLEEAGNDDKYTVVNYRMNWPNSGDPYYTDEGGIRKSYYNVSTVPTCYIDANKANTQSFSSFTSTFNTAFEESPKAEITSQYQIDGSTLADASVSVTVTVIPTEDIANAKLHIAVVEELTTENASTNGETEFHYVMMKMVPDASGTSLSLTADTPETVTDEADLSESNIEEIDDLHVVVWVQETSSKEIINSLFSIEGNTGINNKNIELPQEQISMYHNALNHTLTITNAKNAFISMYDVAGREVMQFKNSIGVGTIDLTHVSHGCYILKIVRNKASSSHIIYNVKQ